MAVAFPKPAVANAGFLLLQMTSTKACFNELETNFNIKVKKKGREYDAHHMRELI